MTKVLIIEDEENLRDVYSEVFQSSGFEVDSAKDGQDGIEKIASFLPDVMLLDILMPKMTGLDVLRHIKGNPAVKKDISILVTTNIYTDNQDLIRNWGVSCVLLKVNYTPGEIVDKVNEIIKMKNNQAQNG